jgi:23S rRNA pseudouridine1911/1915/1917 synthase
LEILCEDGPVIAVNKPAGLLSHGSTQGDPPTVEEAVKAYLKQKYAKPGNVYLGVVHRLDRPVSGVLLFARNSKAAARLAEQFRERTVRKVYWAIVEGRPHPPKGTLKDWLHRTPNQPRTEVVSKEKASARESTLAYHTLAEVPGGTLLEIEPMTGRRHQIRAQLSARGWPIVGDAKYGAHTRLPAIGTTDPLFAPIALHARSLSFQHPIRYEPITLTVPPPNFWRKLIGKPSAWRRLVDEV